jgi:AcrR family transcriptional regulator
MRRLAAELDTGASSLYVYVRNTAELHAHVLDDLLGVVRLPSEGVREPWAESIIRILGSYTAVLLEYPGLARSALVTRPSGPNYLALVDRLLSLLRQGRTPDAQAAWGIDLLLLYATSIALEHGTRRQTLGDNQDEDVLATALLEARVGNFPSIEALGDDLLSGTPRTRFAWHLRALLTGIAATPRHRDEEQHQAGSQP